MTPHIPRIRASVLDALLRSCEAVASVAVGCAFGAAVIVSLAAIVGRMP